MAWSILKVTDGTTSINLLSGPAFYLGEWKPVIAEAKGGGVWRDSPLGEGRRLAFRRFNNAIETFILDVSDTDQEAVIHATQDLRRLLEAALDFWTGTISTPVWIEARAECETSSRYALVYDYRTPQDGDPHGSEFAPGSGRPHFHEWQLLIERGHWMDQPPGASNCVQLSSIQPGYLYGADLILNGGFETLGGGGADVFADWTESAAGVSSGPAIIGARSARLTGSGMAYAVYVRQDCAVAPGDYLLTFYYKNEANYSGYYSVLDLTHGTAIIDNESLPVTLTTKHFRKTFTVPAGCNSVRIVLTAPTLATFHIDFDNVTLMSITDYDFGRAASCDEVHFLGNRFQPAQLTHVYYYDDSAGGFSANLMLAAPPFDLLPFPAGNGDMLYIGVADGSHYPGPFDSVIFNLDNNFSSLVSEIEGRFEYYDASGAWTIIPNDFYSDQTIGASTYGMTLDKPLWDEGVNIFSFFPPRPVAAGIDEWVRTTVNGVYGWWIRFNVSNVINAVEPRLQQVTDKLYTPTIPRLGLDSAQLAGDIASLLSAWVKMNPIYVDNLDLPDAAALTAALRRQSRGADFIPFINVTNDVQIPGITVSALASYALVEHCDFPGRTLYEFTIAAGAGASFVVTLDSTLVNSYRGEFRVFLRIGNRPSTLLPPDARLSVTASGFAVGEWVQAADAESPGEWRMTAYDFGRVSIPVGNTPDKPINSISFFIEFDNNSASNQHCAVYDLVLIPIDECSVSAVDPLPLSTSVAIGGRYLSAVIDSSYFRDPLRSFSYHEPGTWDLTPEYLDKTLQTIGASGLQVSPEHDAYIFFMSPKIREGLAPLLPTAFRPRLYAVSRYLSMRGAR